MNNETRLKTYKGYAIYITQGGRFKAYALLADGKTAGGDVVAETGSLSGLQAKLKVMATRVLQNKKALYRDERHNSIYWRHDDDEDPTLEYIEGTVTDVVVKHGTNYFTLRIEEPVTSSHHNIECQQYHLIKSTPENLERIKEIVRLWKEEIDREKQRKLLEDKLEKWTDAELLTPATEVKE